MELVIINFLNVPISFLAILFCQYIVSSEGLSYHLVVIYTYISEFNVYIHIYRSKYYFSILKQTECILYVIPVLKQIRQVKNLKQTSIQTKQNVYWGRCGLAGGGGQNLLLHVTLLGLIPLSTTHLTLASRNVETSPRQQRYVELINQIHTFYIQQQRLLAASNDITSSSIHNT